jgi:hypothetical protein
MIEIPANIEITCAYRLSEPNICKKRRPLPTDVDKKMSISNNN